MVPQESSPPSSVVATSDNNKEENDLASVESSPQKPVEAPPSGRRRRAFGSAPAKKVVIEAPSSMEEEIMIGEEDREETTPKPSKRAWEMDDDVEDEEEEMESSQDTTVANSQDSSRTGALTTSQEEEEVDFTQEEQEESAAKLEENSDNDKETKERVDGVQPEEDKSAKSEENSDNSRDTKENEPVEKDKDKDDDDQTDAKKTTKKKEPKWEELRKSVDKFFLSVDKHEVTVKDAYKALGAEHNVTLSKPTKKRVRSHLADLINGSVRPEGEVTCSGDEESSEEEEEEEEEPSSEYENDDEEPSSEYEDDEKPARKTKKKKKAAGKKTTNKKKEPKARRKSTRKSEAAKKKASIHEAAEKLRARRMQELRVRNEELQLAQTEEDRKRAEMIAAKFETDTDELRYQRLEDRLDLLQKLDQKRLQIVKVEDIPKQEAMLKKEQEMVTLEEDDDDDDSDDDIELEIVGAGGKNANQPLFPSMAAAASNNNKPKALAVLDMADQVSPRNKNPTEKKKFLANLRKNQTQLSPTRNVNARAQLRNNLRNKQRKMGNMWLARELGYKNEKEHLRDCIEVEKKKRDIVLQREAERLATNERNQLRERLLEPELEGDEESEAGDTNEEDPNKVTEEEDEEMVMAKQMETEQEGAGTAANKDKAVEEEAANVEATKPVEAAVKETSESETKNEAAESAKTDKEGGSDDLSCPKENIAKDSNDSEEPEDDDVEFSHSQDGSFPDAQPLENPTDMDWDLGDSQGVNLDSQPASTEVDSQQFETQASFTVAATTTEESQEGKKQDASVEDGAKEKEVSPESEEGSPKKEGDGEIVDTDDENEEEAEPEKTSPAIKEPKKDRNAAWKAMLESEAKKIKAQKKRKGGSEFLETEADEEEEEEVAGLEDFGFSLHKKKDKDDDDDAGDDTLNADDLKHVVDDLSDDEGDEETGDKKRREMAQKEEKERHKELLRKMRDGYDGRRGGIAGGGAAARGMHRFDQLVAADNREGAKQLGLLNDDELESDGEGKEEKNGDDDEEEDEAALLDTMLKDRFLHRSNVELEENFSDDEEEEDGCKEEGNGDKDEDDDKEQQHLAKRFTKRARIQRLMEEYGGKDSEFSNSRLIDEDNTWKDELSQMKNGLARKRSIGSVSRTSSVTASESSKTSDEHSAKRPKTSSVFGAGFLASKGSLSLALKSSRQRNNKTRTSFLGSSQSSFGGSQDLGISSQKSISFSHVVFQSGGGESQLSCGGASNSQKSFVNPTSRGPKGGLSKTSSLFSNVMQQKSRG